MIHIATVHWETDKWIDIQLKYINRYVTQPFRIYAFLSGSAAKHRDKFYFASTEPIQSHAVKLNVLADIACHEAVSDKDVLIFIDGDAFPIASTDEVFREWLSSSPLAAIQRIENAGDIQPHPSFCITTVGFWRRIGGDWNRGYLWRNRHGVTTDVGGNLLKQLIENNVSWKAIHRSRSLFEHPLWYGLYGDIVYHHGAGFRFPISRLDKQLALNVIASSGFWGKVKSLLLLRLHYFKSGFFIKRTSVYKNLVNKHHHSSIEIYHRISSGYFDSST